MLACEGGELNSAHARFFPSRLHSYEQLLDISPSAAEQTVEINTLRRLAARGKTDIFKAAVARRERITRRATEVNISPFRAVTYKTSPLHTPCVLTDRHPFDSSSHPSVDVLAPARHTRTDQGRLASRSSGFPLQIRRAIRQVPHRGHPVKGKSSESIVEYQIVQ